MPRFIITFALAFAFAVGAFAQAVQHPVRTIEIQHPSGIPDDILLSETRLDPGRSYDHDAIEQAVYRLRRLPFVFSANWRLVGDRLVIVVVPMHRFDFAVEGGVDRNDRFTRGTIEPRVGYRTFVGNGVVDASIGTVDASGGATDFGNVTLAYTAYDLFGKRIVAGLALSEHIATDDAHYDLQPSLRFVVPLTRLQSIVGTATHNGEKRDLLFGSPALPAQMRINSTSGELFWNLDTTDDPYFARTGVRLDAGARYGRVDNEFPSFFSKPTPHIVPFKQSAATGGPLFRANGFLPLGRSGALAGSAEAYSTHSGKTFSGRPETSVENTATLALSYVINFQRPPEDPSDLPYTGRHRLEVGGVYDYARLAIRDHPSSQNDRAGARLAYAYRNTWGTVRITVSFFGD